MTYFKVESKHSFDRSNNDRNLFFFQETLGSNLDQLHVVLAYDSLWVYLILSVKLEYYLEAGNTHFISSTSWQEYCMNLF
jgi:hypothetical protein